MRPDGFVRASDVKACSRFSYLSSADFDELFWKDPIRRFTIIQDFDVRQGADAIWIRSRGVHSIKGVNLHVIRKIRSPEELPMAIYPLRPEEWKRVERHGIEPSEADRFIHLTRSSRSQNFAHGPGATFGVCIYLDVEKMLSSGIRLFTNHKNEVLTSGDRDNILPPHLFKKVVRIQVEKETLLLN
ncbi:hypothetical protein B0H11DRAFT_1998298 [Mycena galericulata]|nr:hypothetical protein B0H11DRAFT_1998298 [Mycena galericulata]